MIPASPPKGFFAYPSSPPTISEVMRAAVSSLNSSGLVNLKTWEDCRVGGKVIIQEICSEISQSQLFCADLTHVNPNVMFELGFAIAQNKRIWLLLDTSLVEEKKAFEQLRILTTVGFTRYCNSRDIDNAFYAEKPYIDLDKGIYDTAIRPNLPPGKSPTLLYLKNRHNTQASVRISKRIADCKIPVIVDDPRESSVQTLIWYGTQVDTSMAVLCHFSNPEREGARLHNARYALVAGMAHGMGKYLLMLEEGDFFIPIDYRDLLQQYTNAAQAISHLEQWLQPIEETWNQQAISYKEYAHSLALASELRNLTLGEYVAENEAEQLTEDYFVETAAFSEALRGNTIIFVGRKGTGKTANLLKLAQSLKQDPRNLVCVIKPVAYELEGIIELLTFYKERSKKGYVIESLWKFLIYSEIACAAITRIKNRPSEDVFQHETALVSLYEKEPHLLQDDFTLRLERCVNNLTATEAKNAEAGTAESFRLAISETIHSGILGDLRKALGSALRDTRRVVVLVDNLDKAWDRRTELATLSDFLLGLLGSAKRVLDDFASSSGRKESVNVSLAVFLRSDIFHQIMSVAREPDKIPYANLSWQDPELLMRVIDERLMANFQPPSSPSAIWERYFTDSVDGVPVRDYILAHILPRPRDLVFLIKSAVSIAINRGHTRVQDIDILEAQKQYSQYALDSILVENGISISALESVVYEFAGSKSVLTAKEVEDTILRAGIPFGQVSQVFEHLCALAFLGVEVEENDYRFAEDIQDYQKLKVLKRKRTYSKGKDLRYKINAPFWNFLEISSVL